ncbi:MAG: SDR family oxidoreductase [Rhodobiaceae bacterium]|nr:SDR family oxidoreductase [Rhodobiaceae bacterium]
MVKSAEPQTILITGANRGLGLELSRQFVARGSDVLACARNPAAAKELQKLAHDHPGRLVIHALDVAEPASVDRVRSAIGARAIDVLINNAGVIGPDRQGALDMDFAGWAYTFAVNTLGPMRMLKAFIANLRASARPRVLNLTSFMGCFSTDGADHIAYRASKAALNRAMKAAAAELAADRIAIAMAHPGWVRTAMGGPGATLSPRDSATGLIALIDALDVEKSGRLFGPDGAEHPW